MNVFSKIPNGVVSNYDVSELEFCNIVYMCIKQKGSSEYSIPDNLTNLVDTVLADIYSLSPDLYKDDWTSKKIVLNESELSKLTFILEN